jgi:hypothetical protein
MRKDLAGYSGEIEMCGLYAGGVIGGVTVGVFADLLHTEYNTMMFYIIGVIGGAFAGYIAGRVFRQIAI